MKAREHRIIWQQKRKLNKKYSDLYFVVSDWGYGDYSRKGPYTAFEALKEVLNINSSPMDKDDIGKLISDNIRPDFIHQFKYHFYDPENYFNGGLINYIAEYNWLLCREMNRNF